VIPLGEQGRRERDRQQTQAETSALAQSLEYGELISVLFPQSEEAKANQLQPTRELLFQRFEGCGSSKLERIFSSLECIQSSPSCLT